MKDKTVNKFDGRNKNEPLRPITEPQQPRMPKMPMQPIRVPYWYPPGTAFNPIGVPPWAHQPAQMPMQPRIPSQPTIPQQPTVPQQPQVPDGSLVDFPRQPGPPVMVDARYLQGYLKENIGQYVRIDFLLGTNTLVDKAGYLVDVGIDFVVLREAETDDLDICDLYSIKFVKIFL